MVGVVAAPHHLVDPDLGEGLGLTRARERRADPHVALEVLRREQGEHGVLVDAELAHPPVGDLVVEGVHPAQGVAEPARALLREDHLEGREPLEHPRHDEVPQGPVAEERRLHREQERPDLGVGVVREPGTPGVVSEGHAELLADGPEPVVVLGEEGRDPGGVGGDAREQHVADPHGVARADVGDGLVDVVEEELPEADPAVRVPGLEVGQPAVVGADADEADRQVLVARGGGDHDTGREERRDGVREHDLAGHALGVEVAVAAVVVPVPAAPVVLEVTERVRVLAPPRVEVVDVLLREVLAVLGVAAPGVAVGRDDRVPAGGGGGHDAPRFGPAPRLGDRAGGVRPRRSGSGGSGPNAANFRPDRKAGRPLHSPLHVGVAESADALA